MMTITRIRTHLVLLLLVIASVACVSTPVQAVDSELAKFYGRYTNSLHRIEVAHRYKVGQFNSTYIKALEKAEEKTEKYGDVQGFETVGEELVRFRATPVLTEDHLHNEPEVLAERQIDALEKINAIHQERETLIARLQKTYLTALSDLKLRTTSKQAAAKVDEALKALKARPEYIPPKQDK